MNLKLLNLDEHVLYREQSPEYAYMFSKFSLMLGSKVKHYLFVIIWHMKVKKVLRYEIFWINFGIFGALYARWTS